MTTNNLAEGARGAAGAAYPPDTGSSAAYEVLRRQHLLEMRTLAPGHFERLSWSTERLRVEREARLRALVRDARERSPWHRKRLADFDPSRLTEDDLPELPTMTKDDLMGHFDEIATDPRLTLEDVEAYLEGLAAGGEPSYLLDRYQAVASGGSSGHRGVFVFDWQGWADSYLGMIRYMLRELMGGSGQTRSGPLAMGVVAAENPTHASSIQPRTFNNPAAVATHRFPVTLPLERIVAGLNETRPDILVGYPSILHRLAFEAQAGALKIAPRAVATTSEPLLPEVRTALEETWSVPIHNWWASSESGPMAISCGHGRGMHLSDDLLIVEPIDAHGNAVAPGVRSAKVHVTNLFSPLLPLIRYEITDEVTLLKEPCPCGSPHQLIEDIQGRLDDTFVYQHVGAVHPHVFRSRLGQERGIFEYEVRQTARGAEVAVRCVGEVDVAALRKDIASALARLGFEKPEVSVRPVGRLERHRSGKLKRFVPLTNGLQ